jgi:hypothetical protein
MASIFRVIANVLGQLNEKRGGRPCIRTLKKYRYLNELLKEEQESRITPLNYADFVVYDFVISLWDVISADKSSGIWGILSDASDRAKKEEKAKVFRSIIPSLLSHYIKYIDGLCKLDVRSPSFQLGQLLQFVVLCNYSPNVVLVNMLQQANPKYQQLSLNCIGLITNYNAVSRIVDVKPKEEIEYDENSTLYEVVQEKKVAGRRHDMRSDQRLMVRGPPRTPVFIEEYEEEDGPSDQMVVYNQRHRPSPNPYNRGPSSNPYDRYTGPSSNPYDRHTGPVHFYDTSMNNMVPVRQQSGFYPIIKDETPASILLMAERHKELAKKRKGGNPVKINANLTTLNEGEFDKFVRSELLTPEEFVVFVVGGHRLALHKMGQKVSLSEYEDPRKVHDGDWVRYLAHIEECVKRKKKADKDNGKDKDDDDEALSVYTGPSFNDVMELAQYCKLYAIIRQYERSSKKNLLPDRTNQRCRNLNIDAMEMVIIQTSVFWSFFSILGGVVKGFFQLAVLNPGFAFLFFLKWAVLVSLAYTAATIIRLAAVPVAMYFFATWFAKGMDSQADRLKCFIKDVFPQLSVFVNTAVDTVTIGTKMYMMAQIYRNGVNGLGDASRTRLWVLGSRISEYLQPGSGYSDDFMARLDSYENPRESFPYNFLYYADSIFMYATTEQMGRAFKAGLSDTDFLDGEFRTIDGCDYPVVLGIGNGKEEVVLTKKRVLIDNVVYGVFAGISGGTAAAAKVAGGGANIISETADRYLTAFSGNHYILYDGLEYKVNDGSVTVGGKVYEVDYSDVKPQTILINRVAYELTHDFPLGSESRLAVKNTVVALGDSDTLIVVISGVDSNLGAYYSFGKEYGLIDGSLHEIAGDHIRVKGRELPIRRHPEGGHVYWHGRFYLVVHGRMYIDTERKVTFNGVDYKVLGGGSTRGLGEGESGSMEYMLVNFQLVPIRKEGVDENVFYMGKEYLIIQGKMRAKKTERGAIGGDEIKQIGGGETVPDEPSKSVVKKIRVSGIDYVFHPDQSNGNDGYVDSGRTMIFRGQVLNLYMGVKEGIWYGYTQTHRNAVKINGKFRSVLDLSSGFMEDLISSEFSNNDGVSAQVANGTLLSNSTESVGNGTLVSNSTRPGFSETFLSNSTESVGNGTVVSNSTRPGFNGTLLSNSTRPGFHETLLSNSTVPVFNGTLVSNSTAFEVETNHLNVPVSVEMKEKRTEKKKGSKKKTFHGWSGTTRVIEDEKTIMAKSLERVQFFEREQCMGANQTGYFDVVNDPEGAMMKWVLLGDESESISPVHKREFEDVFLNASSALSENKVEDELPSKPTGPLPLSDTGINSIVADFPDYIPPESLPSKQVEPITLSSSFSHLGSVHAMGVRFGLAAALTGLLHFLWKWQDENGRLVYERSRGWKMVDLDSKRYSILSRTRYLEDDEVPGRFKRFVALNRTNIWLFLCTFLLFCPLPRV